MRTPVAVAIVLLVVAAAVAAGMGLGTLLRPAPTPIVVSVTPTPTPSPTRVAVSEATLFAQPLSAGCATQNGVWLVTNGGGLLRYDGTAWDQVDDTLRSLTAVACGDSFAYAVGRVGALVAIDEVAREIRSRDVAFYDLWGISLLSDGALMVGSVGTVYIIVGSDAQPYAAGIDEDLRDVVAFSQTSAWVVGADGITYRLDSRGWLPIGSGQPNTLHAVAARSVGSVFAVGDKGTFVAWDNGWRVVPTGVDVTLRDLIVAPALWIVGDGGTVLTTGARVGELRRVDIGTACDLVSVFASGDAVWVVARGAGGGGVFRLASDGTVQRKWGRC